MTLLYVWSCDFLYSAYLLYFQNYSLPEPKHFPEVITFAQSLVRRCRTSMSVPCTERDGTQNLIWKIFIAKQHLSYSLVPNPPTFVLVSGLTLDIKIWEKPSQITTSSYQVGPMKNQTANNSRCALSICVFVFVLHCKTNPVQLKRNPFESWVCQG